MRGLPFLQVALEAAKKVEPLLSSYPPPDAGIRQKVDGSPVSRAEEAAEAAIIDTLLGAFPDHAILGEESGVQGNDRSEYLWVIDPIDGTRNWLRSIPIFATQIALLHKNQPILGVSNAPQLHELMYAQEGGGAFRNGGPVRVSSIRSLSDAFLTFSSPQYFHETGHASQFAEIVSAVGYSRGFGDFWGFHLLAQGKVDCYPDVGVELWDIAAVTVIVREAGGMVTDLAGQPITRSSRSILATNGLLHESALGYFAGR